MTDDYIDKNIRDTIKENGGNLSKTSRVLGLNLEYLRAKFGDQIVSMATYRPEPRPSDIRTLGKPGMEKFVIAIKNRGFSWPVEFTDIIADGRRKFDAGTHVMCQGHTRGWAVLYLIPRRRPVAAMTYFSSMGEFDVE